MIRVRKWPAMPKSPKIQGLASTSVIHHSPWQRGANENINGLIRQYLPKGTDLSVHSQAVLDEIALELNMRPRKRFGFRCPIEQLTKVMLAEHNKPISRH